MRTLLLTLALALPAFTFTSQAAELADTIERIRGSIVGIGTHSATRQPPSRLMGTGFVVADGHHVVTNAHVLPLELDAERRESLVAFSGRGRQARLHAATLVARDNTHDLALLRIEGGPLPAMRLDVSHRVREGELYAFTGFPIGAVLGLFPVTHRGIISSISPIVIPVSDSRQLTREMIRRLSDPYEVYQLDATAYPGNSGSPLFDPDSGAVIGIINRVFVKESKEAILEKPSGISYAVPVKHLQRLLEEAKQNPAQGDRAAR